MTPRDRAELVADAVRAGALIVPVVAAAIDVAVQEALAERCIAEDAVVTAARVLIVAWQCGPPHDRVHAVISAEAALVRAVRGVS